MQKGLIFFSTMVIALFLLQPASASTTKNGPSDNISPYQITPKFAKRVIGNPRPSEALPNDTEVKK